MTQERLQFYTPVGRFVSGSLTEKRTKDLNNREIDPDKQRYEFGLAIRKDDPGLMPLITQIATHAKAGYQNSPHIVQRIDNWFRTLDGFSMKISDGDAPNSRGVINQNTVGHFVFWFSTSMEILAANRNNQQIDIATIKRGWFVDLSGNCAVNGLTDHNAGVYLNPVCVRLIAEGEEILGGLTVEAALEHAPPAPTALPPGARPVGSTPKAPTSSGLPGTGLPGNPTQPATGAPAAAMPGVQGGTLPSAGAGLPGATTASLGDAPQTGYPPHTGILGTGLPGQG